MECPAPSRPSAQDREGLSISLAVIGVCARDLPPEAADVVIMAGLAGALDPSLAVGDLIIDDWPTGLVLPAGAKRGSIHSAAKIAATPQEKRDCFAQTHALAVDMENAAVREWARRSFQRSSIDASGGGAARLPSGEMPSGRLGASFGAIRAISDRADQSLDPVVLRLVDAWGRPRILQILRTLVVRPALLPHLMRLGADSKKAAARLGTACNETVSRMVQAARC